MAIVTLFLQITLLSFILYYFYKKFIRSELDDDVFERPPTPPKLSGVPILGYLPFMTKDPYKVFAQQGDIFAVDIGVIKAVVINKFELIKEAFVKNSFACRPEQPSFLAFREAGFKLLTGHAAEAKFLRKHALKALSLFSSSKNSRLEALMDKGCETMFDEFKEVSGAFNPKKIIMRNAVKIIGAINFGMEFDDDDPILEQVWKFNEKANDIGAAGDLTDSFPFGKYIFTKPFKILREAVYPVKESLTKFIMDRDCKTGEDDVRYISDALFTAALDSSDDQKKELGVSDQDIRLISLDLFTAGFTTVTDSFQWTLNILAERQDVQNTIHEELDSVMQCRKIVLGDEKKLPYLLATITEMFRFVSLVPFNLPHRPSEDTVIGGFLIPKDTLILPNAWAVHMNEKLFKKPDQFNPSRFLKQDGSYDMDKAQNIIPFGVGKRRCVGENLARQELFLLISRCLQKFRVKPGPGVKIDISECEPKFQREPVQYELIFEKRV